MVSGDSEGLLSLPEYKSLRLFDVMIISAEPSAAWAKA
jgi:hypothetical protein